MIDLAKIREMALRVAASEGLNLVDVEVKGGRSNPLLRVYIDKAGGVTHADCQNVSEQMSALLDVEDPFPGSYLLEVSSPGLDRELTRPEDFSYFEGRRARLVLREAAGSQNVLEGHLAGLHDGKVRVDLGEGGVQELELANIRRAQLVVEF